MDLGLQDLNVGVHGCLQLKPCMPHHVKYYSGVWKSVFTWMHQELSKRLQEMSTVDQQYRSLQLLRDPVARLWPESIECVDRAESIQAAIRHPRPGPPRCIDEREAGWNANGGKEKQNYHRPLTITRTNASTLLFHVITKVLWPIPFLHIILLIYIIIKIVLPLYCV